MTEPDRLSVAEVIEQIEQLDDESYTRMLLVAKAFSPVTPTMSMDDYLNEALTRLIEGNRTVPRSQDFSTAVMSIMRSLADEACKRQIVVNGEMPEDDELPGETSDPVHELICSEHLTRLEAMICQDQTAVNILRMRASGHDKNEIIKQLNIKPTTYDSANKRIRRAVLSYEKEAVT